MLLDSVIFISCFCIIIPWFYFHLSLIHAPLFCILYIMLLYPYTLMLFPPTSDPYSSILYSLYHDSVSNIRDHGTTFLYPLSNSTVLLYPLYILCILYSVCTLYINIYICISCYYSPRRNHHILVTSSTMRSKQIRIDGEGIMVHVGATSFYSI